MAEVAPPAPYVRPLLERQCAVVDYLPTVIYEVVLHQTLFQPCLGPGAVREKSVGPVGARRSVGISAQERYQVVKVGWEFTANS